MSQMGFAVPGFTTARENSEAEIFWGPLELRHLHNGLISGAARDTANSPTTVLRPGLVLGLITASNLYAQYSPTATDGTAVARAIALLECRATDIDGNNQNRLMPIAVGGPIKAANLIGLDSLARRQLANNFLFDDDLPGRQFLGGPLKEVAKTADYSVVAADNGTLFTTTAAAGNVVFTLPTIARGLMFEFLNVVDFNMTVASAAGDDMVSINDASADSIAFSTGSQKIGGHVIVHSNDAGTKWYVRNLSPGNTITTAT
ncbi:MAG: hypothetical protein A3E01_02750 [Gammaproteobacteria bacterium RIFCSPHIGHO2_12_FULL_63_22]|nr:MAG: hypothetical protein A3E01_02750 [Gammaproteobacteria bacterium RIFCSPHIGHO2_12_FULL_63_22]